MASDHTPYVCTLDEETQKKAKDELYEDPKNRQGAIDTFREWIQQQKHIKCPTDNIFLLAFLRAKHFSQLESRKALERFLQHRDKMSTWAKNLDITEKDIDEVIDTGVLFLSPERDDDGRMIIILNPGRVDFGNKKQYTAYIRLFCILSYYTYLIDEMSQVHGTVFIADWGDHTLANAMKLSVETQKDLTLLFTKSYPARVKGMHMINTGSLLEFLTNMFMKIVPDGLKQRLHFHNRSLETLYKHINMKALPTHYLPDDYTGPNVGTEENLKGHLRELLGKPEIRDRIKYLSSDQFYINMKEKDTQTPATSFRQLKVD